MVAQAVTPDRPDLRIQTEFRGAVARLFDPSEAVGEIVVSGPQGTGKTRSILEWIHMRCSNEKLRVLIIRKTQESLKASAMVTFIEQVLYDFNGKRSPVDGVTYFGGNNIRPPDFTYDRTGSKITIGGMDNPKKVLSTEYDIIYWPECTEASLGEWESLGGRTDRPRLGKQRPPSLVIGDCNPDAPTHWIIRRATEGTLKLWPTVHEDNPAMWDRHRKEWTPQGRTYLNRLDKYTGVRYDRNRAGLWVAAEGQVYEAWSPGVHLIERFDVPADWSRFRVIDFGYRNPFVCQWWAESPDGDLYRYRELYRRGMLVSDAAQKINRHSAGETYQGKAICDHDAEDRATLEDNGIPTCAANKAVKTGIEAVQDRMRVDERGTARLYLMRGVNVEREDELEEESKPTCTEEEIPGYVWDDKAAKEAPVKINDHGCDCVRYLVMHIDNPGPPAFAPLDGDLGDWFREGGASW